MKLKTVRYELRSSFAHFWLPYLRGEDMGNGKLIDGSFDYRDSVLDLQGLPRHFDSDRRSGFRKKDAGISPFAFSNRLTADDLGALFFDPAAKYPGMFRIDGPWSREYLLHPYR